MRLGDPWYRQQPTPTGKYLVLLCVLLQVGVLVLDLLLPLGIAIGILYVAILLPGLWYPNARLTVGLALSGSLLTITGYFLSPAPSPEIAEWEPIANRALAVLAIAIVAALTLRHRAIMAALREGSANLRRAQVITGLGHYHLTRRAGGGDFWCERCREIVGNDLAGGSIAYEELIARFVHEADSMQVQQAFAAAVEQGVPYDLEFRVVRTNGDIRYVQSSGEALRESGGKDDLVLGTMLDITEQRAIEDALSAREAKLRSILETAPEAIVTIDERGTVEAFSTSAESLFGWKAEEIVGQNVSVLMPEPYRSGHDAYVRRYLNTGEARIIGIGRVVEGQRKDGTVFPMELAVGEVASKGARVFTGFVRDLTARQRMELELRQAQKMEAVGQLTGGIAHDFNNLLTVVAGNLEMLEPRLEADETARTLLHEAQEAVELGAQLTDRLLSFGRRQSLHPQTVELGPIISESMTLLQRTLGEPIEVRAKLSSRLRPVLIDPGQLQNAIINLAVNARDAMPDGGILSIEAENVQIDPDFVEMHPEARLGNYVMISVSDTGIGMTPEVRSRALEPFFTTKGVGAGTGLGLSMVYGFIRQSGGHIQIYSEPDQGTTVRLYLPWAEAAGATTGKAAEDSPGNYPGRGERILLVEDEPRVRRVTMARLRDLGYQVLEAPSGPAALKLLDEVDGIDLLFTDMVMPEGMNGLELAHAVRARHPDLPVLLSSGYAEPETVRRDHLEGSEWLKKPSSALEVARTVRRVLDARISYRPRARPLPRKDSPPP